MSIWTKTNKIVKQIFYHHIWDIPNDEKKVFLTFDDGPTPEITEWILNELKKYNAKATFFLIGDNIDKHPELFQKLNTEEFTIGNHTYNHLNGWMTSKKNYIENVLLCENSIGRLTENNNKLFRPPYGKIKPSQAYSLRKLGYKLIMWDVLSSDYKLNITPEDCLENVISNVESGSIIVFHDSLKAFPNLQYALPKTLDFLYKNGYTCEKIT